MPSDSTSLTAPAWRAVAELTGIRAGTRVLDVGCSAGGFCALAAARGALVAGVDSARDRIAAARERVPGGDFEVALMEQLPWTDDAFDVVTGFNSFQYALDVPGALAEACRVTRPGGLLVVCKYGTPAENEFFALLGALGRVDLGRLPALDDVDRALAALDVRERGEIAAELTFANDDALVAALGDTRALAAAARYRRPDGSYRFAQPLKYRIVTVSPSRRRR